MSTGRSYNKMPKNPTKAMAKELAKPAKEVQVLLAVLKVISNSLREIRKEIVNIELAVSEIRKKYDL